MAEEGVLSGFDLDILLKKAKEGPDWVTYTVKDSFKELIKGNARGLEFRRDDGSRFKKRWFHIEDDGSLAFEMRTTDVEEEPTIVSPITIYDDFEQLKSEHSQDQYIFYDKDSIQGFKTEEGDEPAKGKIGKLVDIDKLPFNGTFIMVGEDGAAYLVAGLQKGKNVAAVALDPIFDNIRDMDTVDALVISWNVILVIIVVIIVILVVAGLILLIVASDGKIDLPDLGKIDLPDLGKLDIPFFKMPDPKIPAMDVSHVGYYQSGGTPGLDLAMSASQSHSPGYGGGVEPPPEDEGLKDKIFMNRRKMKRILYVMGILEYGDE